MKYSLTIILLFFVASVFAQQDVKSNKLVQFSGIITDTDSNSVVPYVTPVSYTHLDVYKRQP